MTVAVVGSSLVASKRLPQSQRAPGMYRDSVTLQRYGLDGTLGEALDGVPNVETRQHPMGSYPAPFGKRLQVTSKQGWMVTGFPEHFEIASRNQDGKVARIVRLSKPDVPMTAAVVDKHKARLFDNFGGSPEERSAMEADLALDQLPKTLPAYSAVKVDGMGRVWVREYIELDGMGPMNADMGKGPRWRPDVPARWYVFSNDGEFLGTVRLPLGFVVHDIGKDHIVGVQELHIGPCGHGEPYVACRRCPLVRLVDDAEREGALRLQDPQDGQGVITAPIVHADHLQVPVRLAEHMVQTALQVGRHVVTGDDHGDHHTTGEEGMGSGVRGERCLL